jgi:hypothetical protein
MNHPAQNLRIHIHKVDGSMETFTQSEADLVNGILNEFQPVRIFNQEKIIIAGNNSLTSFPVHQVVRIDLVSENLSHWILPPGIVDAVELTETEFRALLQNPELHDRWNQARTQETSVVTFLDLEMAGQKQLFLAMEVISETQAEPSATFPFPLSMPTLCFRMRTGGIAALNLVNLTRLTLFPGPQPAPAKAWPAHQANGSPPDRFAGDLRGSVAGKQPLPRFPQNHRTNFTPSRMESK